MSKKLIWEQCFIKTEKCWIWTAGKYFAGYGNFRQSTAHRTSYIKYKGKIPKDYLIHHTCHNRLCVNPKHLIATTRSNHRKLDREFVKHCKQGHKFTSKNTEIKYDGARRCRECHKQHTKKWREKKMGLKLA